jgi:hypothetical protein
MGWFWDNSTSKTSDASTQTAPRSPPPATPVETPSARDAQADAELASFLQEISADVHTSSTKYNRVPKPPPARPSKATSDAVAAPVAVQDMPETSSLAESLLPTEMSCRQAFDSAFYCQSMGGQFNNLYRYGGVRSCSENWSDFWFCMKAKSAGGNEQKGMCHLPLSLYSLSR